jgi:molybdenum cofactor guanylyltransferase
MAQAKPKNIRDNITGVILAGGLARRMNGQDKGLINYQGRALIEYILSDFKSQVSTCMISANRNIARYQAYNYPIYTDEIGDFSGPLAGIATALRHCKTDWLAYIPCDAYCIPHDLITRLSQAQQQTQAKLCIVDDGQRLQPLYALIHISLLSDLEDYLNQGKRRVMQWTQAQALAIVDFSDQQALFRNINTLF